MSSATHDLVALLSLEQAMRELLHSTWRDIAGPGGSHNLETYMGLLNARKGVLVGGRSPRTQEHIMMKIRRVL